MVIEEINKIYFGMKYRNIFIINGKDLLGLFIIMSIYNIFLWFWGFYKCYDFNGGELW